MSGISSGIGLISGLPTSTLIDQLIALERRPIERLQARTATLKGQRTAFADISARLLAVKSVVARFKERAFFQRFGATSSQPDVLTATAGEKASAGSFSFVVQSLVSNHQMLGRGFATRDATPVGAGDVTIEVGRGNVAPSTSLDQLNGGDGVRRGKIRITDRRGESVDVDLGAALTVDDVLRRINGQAVANVRASVEGDRIVIDDLTGLSTGSLSVTDLFGGHAAADLGLAQSVAGARISGSDIVYLGDSTSLDALNDGSGVRRHVAGNDFRITQSDGVSFEVSLSGALATAPTTKLAQFNNGEGVRLGTVRLTDRSGASAEVDLTGAVTAQDVLDRLNASGLAINVIVVGSHFQVQDSSGATGESAANLKIEDVSGFAARDLGIAADVAQASFIGSDVYRISTVGDVVRAINLHAGNDGSIVASISADGNGITLTDQSIGADPLRVEALQVGGGRFSGAAADLGIEGVFTGQTTPRRDLVAGLDTVLLSSLNGGNGIGRGAIRLTAADGATADVDLSAAQTLGDVIASINAVSATSKVTASVNRAGNGILLRDTSGGATVNFSVQDLNGGTLAADLGLAAGVAGSTINGGNAQLRYVSENTRLSELNYGAGIRTGQVQISDSSGAVKVINVTQNQKTLAQVIDLINASGAAVSASVNATGDGLLVTDRAGGTGKLKIQDLSGGFAAADLRIAGESAVGETTIDGSYEITVSIDADDTLDDVVAKVNSASVHVRAGVLNDGGRNAPYRLTLSSQVSGSRGELIFDGGDTSVELETLVKAQDAVVFFGGAGAERPAVVTSSSNTLTDVIGGVTIELLSVSEDPVSLSVTQDVDSIVADLKTFTDNYNAVIDRIDELTSFDSETLQRGPLLGDPTLQRIESRLRSGISRRYQNVPESFSRLFSLGLGLGSGGRLQFDEERFRAAYQADPASVEAVFTTDENGAGDILDKALDDLTRAGDGLIARADNLLGDREELLSTRISGLNLALERKRVRLEAQFAGLERSLSLLQGQQNALLSLSQAGGGAG